MDLKCLDNVDWQLLRKQKETLAMVAMSDDRRLDAEDTAHLDGLLNLLDAVQDEAAEQIGEFKVFGTISQDGHASD